MSYISRLCQPHESYQKTLSLSLSYVTGSVKGLQFGPFAEQVRSGKQPPQIEVSASDFRYLCVVERKLSIFFLFIKSCFN